MHAVCIAPQSWLYHWDVTTTFREIDEDLYLSVLACRRAETAGCDSDLAYATDQQQGTVGATKGP
jgi:hypothetical protein